MLILAAAIFQGSEGWAYDFRAYDEAARRLLNGEPLYLPGTAGAYRSGAYEGLYLYPPPVAISFVPLALLPPESAAFVWFALRLALLIVGCAAMPVSRAARLGTFAVACVSFPVLFDLNLGNISVVLFALTAVAWRLGDGWVAGIVHAALAMLRIPFLVFGVQWLFQRRWTMVARTVLAGIVILLLSVPIVGLDAYREYLALLTGLPDVSAGEHNFSLKSIALGAGFGPEIATAGLVLGVVLGASAIAYAAARRDRDTAFVVTATATLLTAPFLHPHYLVILLIPAAFLVDRLTPVAVALPLAGWLPGDVLPVAALVVLLVLLLPAVARREIGPTVEAPAVPARP